MQEIVLKKLYESDNDKDHFLYSEEAELALSTLVFGEKNIKNISSGYAPGYDVELANGKTVEIKIKSGRDLFIEFSQLSRAGERVDSGMALSKADYWLFVTLGGGGSYKHVGKLRLFKKSKLLSSIVRGLKYNPSLYYYHKYNSGTEADGVIIKPNALKEDVVGKDVLSHHWLGNLDAEVSSKGVADKYSLVNKFITRDWGENATLQI